MKSHKLITFLLLILLFSLILEAEFAVMRIFSTYKEIVFDLNHSIIYLAGY